MVNTTQTTGIYAKLENRPGTLARVLNALASHQLNVDALSLETVGSTGFARLWTSKPREAMNALRSAGVECYESPTLLASLPNRPGEIARATQEIATAGINVESVTITPDARVAFRTSNNELAEQVLRKM